MKNISLLCTTSVAILALGIFALPHGHCADPQPQNTPAPENPQDTSGINIDIPENTTVGDAIALLKKKYPQYNYMVSSSAVEAVKLREIKIRNANLSLLAQALDIAGNEQIECGGNSNLNILQIDAAYSEATRTVVNVYNISGWLASASANEKSALADKIAAVKTLQLMSAEEYFDKWPPADPGTAEIFGKYRDGVTELRALLEKGMAQNHPDVKSLQAQLDAWKKQLDDAFGTIRKNEKTNLDAAEAEMDEKQVRADFRLANLDEMIANIISFVNAQAVQTGGVKIAPPHTSYYPAGGILVVVGTASAQDLVAKIIGALPGGGLPAKPAPSVPAQQPNP